MTEPLSPTPAEHEPWLRYRDTGLHVIPSVHHRLAFARAVWEACWREPFDVLAVELPSIYQESGLVEAVLRIAPYTGLVIAPELAGRPGTPLPHDMEGPVCGRGGEVLPVSPCDSIVMALRCPSLLESRWPGWRPQVRLIDGDDAGSRRRRRNPRGARVPADDYEIGVAGLSSYYERHEALFQAARDASVDSPRERAMAWHLWQLLEAGRRVLFVCGAAHWASIRDLLDRGRLDEPSLSRAVPRAELVAASLEPAVAWRCGWLDDAPRTTWEFESACRSGQGGTFDKRAAVETLLRESVHEATQAGVPVSPRRLLTMRRHGEALLSAEGRWTPRLDDDLVPNAETSVERRFAEKVEEVGLRYPAPPPEGLEQATLLVADDSLLVARVGGEVFVLTELGGGSAGRRFHVREEGEGIESAGSHLRDWPGEVNLCRTLDQRARALVRRRHCAPRSLRFTGAMGMGPDWRRTIRSHATGEARLYIREGGRGRRNPRRPPRMVTPVVWVFDDRCAVAGHESTEQPLSDARWFYSSFLYVAEDTRLAGRRIRALKLAAFVDLFFSRSYCKSIRGLTPAEEKAADIAYLRKVPPEKRCSVVPWRDGELGGFSGVDQAVAAAVKYADDEVILVSRSASPVSSGIAAFANDRGVFIHRLSVDDFEPRRLDRFRWLHFVPAPVDSYQPPYAWCDRYVPPA